MVDGNKIAIIFYFIYYVCANYKCCIMPSSGPDLENKVSCRFKSRRGKNKNLTALKSNSNTVWFNFQTCIYSYIYIHIYIMIINNKCKQVFYNSVWVYSIYTH
jgi:hypothetical protein